MKVYIHLKWFCVTYDVVDIAQRIHITYIDRKSTLAIKKLSENEEEEKEIK